MSVREDSSRCLLKAGGGQRRCLSGLAHAHCCGCSQVTYRNRLIEQGVLYMGSALSC